MKKTPLLNTQLVQHMDVPRMPNVLMLDAGENLDDYVFLRGDLLDALSVNIYFNDIKTSVIDGFDVVTTKLRNHISDTHCHTNDVEKRYWNNKLDKSEYDEDLQIIQDRIKHFEDMLGNIDWSTVDLTNFITADQLAAALANIDWNTVNPDLSGYVKTGSVLGTINGVTFRQGSNITISGGSADLSNYVQRNDLKTINGQSLLGSGDITIEGGEGSGYVLTAASSDALGGIKVGYVNNGKNYKVQLDENNHAFVNVPWYPGEEGGGTYDDTEIRNSIDDLIDRLSALLNSISTSVHDAVLDLFSEEEWMRENFPWDLIFNVQGWDDKISGYISTVGFITEDSTTWTNLTLTLTELSGRVTELERGSGGGSTISGADIVLKLTLEGYPLAEMKSFYESLDSDKNILLQLASGFRSWTLSDVGTFASEYSSFVNSTERGFSSVNTSIDTLDGKITTVRTDLTAMYNNIINGTTTISGVLTEANADGALAEIFARKDSAVAAIVAKINDDNSNITISADKIYLNGSTFADYISANYINTGNLSAKLAEIEDLTLTGTFHGTFRTEVNNRYYAEIYSSNANGAWLKLCDNSVSGVFKDVASLFTKNDTTMLSLESLDSVRRLTCTPQYISLKFGDASINIGIYNGVPEITLSDGNGHTKTITATN